MIRKTIFILLLTTLLPIKVGLCVCEEEIFIISLINLIASPSEYHGKKVRVIGVSVIEFEGDSLYLSKEHLLNAVTKNAVWISPNYNTLETTEEKLSKYNGEYALVEGTFNKDGHGHMGLFSGSIENITRFVPWPSEDVKERLTKRFIGQREQPRCK
jgi:hypothetical protein